MSADLAIATAFRASGAARRLGTQQWIAMPNDRRGKLISQYARAPVMINAY
jgi:hypothetical protein